MKTFRSRPGAWALACIPVLAAAPVLTSAAATNAALFGDLEEEYEELLDAYDEAHAGWLEQMSAATETERAAVFAKDPTAGFVPKFVAFARKAGASPVALDAHVWVVAHPGSDSTAALDSLDKLVLEHMDSAGLEDVVPALEYAWIPSRLGRERVENALHDIRDQTPHDEVRHGATFMLAKLMHSFDEKDAALPLLLEIRESKDESPWQAKSEQLLFELENLQIGMMAPDFASTDQDGVAFKLSDYKGKVVVLDFWGFW